MGEDFKDFEMEAPALTLEPDLGELEPEVSEPQVQVQIGRASCRERV